jgi:hypothetical protein
MPSAMGTNMALNQRAIGGGIVLQRREYRRGILHTSSTATAQAWHATHATQKTPHRHATKYLAGRVARVRAILLRHTLDRTRDQDTVGCSGDSCRDGVGVVRPADDPACTGCTRRGVPRRRVAGVGDGVNRGGAVVLDCRLHRLLCARQHSAVQRAAAQHRPRLPCRSVHRLGRMHRDGIRRRIGRSCKGLVRKAAAHDRQVRLLHAAVGDGEGESSSREGVPPKHNQACRNRRTRQGDHVKCAASASAEGEADADAARAVAHPT